MVIICQLFIYFRLFAFCFIAILNMKFTSQFLRYLTADGEKKRQYSGNKKKFLMLLEILYSSKHSI